MTASLVGAAILAVLVLGRAVPSRPTESQVPKPGVEVRSMKATEDVAVPPTAGVERIQQALVRSRAIRRQQPANIRAIVLALREVDALATELESALPRPTTGPTPAGGSVASQPGRACPPTAAGAAEHPAGRPDPDALDRRLDQTHLRPRPGMRGSIEAPRRLASPEMVRQSCAEVHSQTRAALDWLGPILEAKRPLSEQEGLALERALTLLEGAARRMTTDTPAPTGGAARPGRAGGEGPVPAPTTPGRTEP